MKSANSIKNLMDTTLESIRTTIDANTIIGDPIKTETTVVVPISKVTIGFGIGGGEYSKGNNNRDKDENNDIDSNFAGGSAGAITVQPVAFVVVEEGETRLMSLDNNINMVDNILSVTPKILEKIQKLKNNETINSSESVKRQ